jgi:SepF-like predicted cell division protein (DUF552 family)
MTYLIFFVIILCSIVFWSKLFDKSDTFEDVRNYQNSAVYIKKSVSGGKYGRGIYSNTVFNINDIIEVAPCVEDKFDTFNGIIRDYVFKKSDETAVVAFGFVSIYNHSDTPNAEWSINDSDIIIKAIKPIKQDEEIFISYGDNYWTLRENLEKK